MSNGELTSAENRKKITVRDTYTYVPSSKSGAEKFMICYTDRQMGNRHTVRPNTKGHLPLFVLEL